jgi:sterol 14-demethylase
MGWLPYGLDTTIQMAKSPVTFAYEARKKYGDCYSVYILGQFVTFVFNPKAVKTYFFSNEDKISFSNGSRRLLGDFMVGSEYMTNGDNLVVFHRALTRKRMLDIVPIFDHMSKELLSDQLFDNGKKTECIVPDLWRFSYDTVFNFNCFGFCGEQVYRENGAEFLRLFESCDVEKMLLNPLVTILKKRIGLAGAADSAFEQMIKMLTPIIEERRSDPSKHDDILQVIVSFVEEKVTSGQLDKFDHRYVVYLVNSMFFAAQTNTFATLSWMFIYIENAKLNNPSLYEDIMNEVNNAPTVLTGEYILEKTPVLEAAIYETIRLGNAGISFRSVEQNVLIEREDGGVYNVPKNNFIMNPSLMDGVDMQQTEEFDPYRYLPPRNEQKRDPNYYSWFGRGRHPCLGADYVKMQLRQFFIIVYRNCKIEIEPDVIKQVIHEANSAQIIGIKRPARVVPLKFIKV